MGGVQLRTDVANADGSTPTHFILEYSRRPLDLNSGPHSNSSRDAARGPQAASPGSQQQELTSQAAASRGHCRGPAGRGGAPVGEGRCARESGSKPGVAWPQSPQPLRVELGSLAPSLLPGPAAARPVRVAAPRRAAPRPLCRFRGPRRDGVAMVTARQPGGGSTHEEATVTCAGSTARRGHLGAHGGHTDPAASGPAWAGDGWRGGCGASVPGL